MLRSLRVDIAEGLSLRCAPCGWVPSGCVAKRRNSIANAPDLVFRECTSGSFETFRHTCVWVQCCPGSASFDPMIPQSFQQLRQMLPALPTTPGVSDQSSFARRRQLSGWICSSAPASSSLRGNSGSSADAARAAEACSRHGRSHSSAQPF